MLAFDDFGLGSGARAPVHEWGHRAGGYPVPEHSCGVASGREAQAQESHVGTGLTRSLFLLCSAACAACSVRPAGAGLLAFRSWGLRSVSGSIFVILLSNQTMLNLY